MKAVSELEKKAENSRQRIISARYNGTVLSRYHHLSGARIQWYRQPNHIIVEQECQRTVSAASS